MSNKLAPYAIYSRADWCIADIEFNRTARFPCADANENGRATEKGSDREKERVRRKKKKRDATRWDNSHGETSHRHLNAPIIEPIAIRSEWMKKKKRKKKADSCRNNLALLLSAIRLYMPVYSLYITSDIKAQQSANSFVYEHPGLRWLKTPSSRRTNSQSSNSG